MVGRIETYIHSDNITPNKGGVLIYVKCDTDFAARTPEFIEFSKLAAKRAFASGAENWNAAADLFPDVEDARIELEKKLRETVTVEDIRILNI